MKRILAFLALTSCAFAGTWIAAPGKGSHVAAGGSPAISAVTELGRNTNDSEFSSATITATLTAGRAYALFAKTEVGGPLVVTMTGANSGTMTQGNLITNSSLYGRWYYVTSMANSGSTTFTGELFSGEWARCWLVEITYSGGTASIDVNTSTGTGTATTATSASFSTTAAVEVVLAGVSNDTSKTYSSPTIAGSAATTGTAYGDSQVFWRILSATVSSQTASINTGGSSIYCVPVISIKVQ